MSQDGFPEGIHLVEVDRRPLQNSLAVVDWPHLANSSNVSQHIQLLQLVLQIYVILANNFKNFLLMNYMASFK